MQFTLPKIMVGYTDLMELRSMSGKEHWQSADFEKIMIATVLSGEERIRHTPQSINMDCWSKLRRDVRQVTAETGSEQWVGFYIDRQKKVFNIPPLTIYFIYGESNYSNRQC